jgi:hypothetical protein
MDLVAQVARAAQRYRDSVGEEVQKLSLDFLIDTLVASQHAGRLIHFVCFMFQHNPATYPGSSVIKLRNGH